MSQRHKSDQARLESLVRISRYEAPSLQDLFNYALGEIVALTGSKVGCIFFYDETTRQFRLNTWSKNALNIWKSLSPQGVYNLDQTGLWGEAVRQSKPIVINDFKISSPSRQGFPAAPPSLQRFMTVPVFSKGKVVAVLGLANKRNAYTDNDVRQAVLMMDSIWPITRRKEDYNDPAGSAPSETDRKAASSREDVRQNVPKEDEQPGGDLLRIARLAAIVEDSENAIIGTDIDGSITDWNRSAARISGYRESEILGKPLSTLVPPDKQNEFDNIIAAIKAGQHIPSFETRWLRKSGETFFVSLSVSGIRNKKGLPAGLSIIGRDITERKNNEAELERYRNFIVNIADACFEFDLQGRATFCNTITHRILGYTKEEYMNLRHSQRYATKEKAEKIYSIFNELYRSNHPVRVFEAELLCKDGSEITMEISISLIRNEDGVVTGFRGIGRDITARKQAQAALEQSEARYRSIFQYNKAVMLLADPQTGAIVDANLEACSYYQYSRNDLLALNITDLLVQTKEEVAAEIKRAAMECRRQYYFSHRLAGGEERAVEVFSGPVEIGGKELSYSIVHDITDRRKAEEALRSSEEKYRTILENISEGYFECNINGKIVFVNDAGRILSGYDRESLFNIDFHRFTTPETQIRIQEAFQTVIRTGEQSKMDDYEFVRADGAVRVHQLNVKLIRNDRGQPSGFRIVARDITEKKQAEEKLRRSEEKYRSIMESIIEGYLEYDLKGSFTFANDAACTMMGYPREELLSMNYSQIASSQTLKFIDQTTRDVAATGAPRKLVDFEIIRKDGTRRIHQHNLSLIRDPDGKPAGIRAMGRDVTELKWAEEALRQSEERIRLLFRNIPVPTFVWKAQHDQYILSEFNSAAFQFIGDKIIDALGKPAEQFFASMPQITSDITRCMEMKRNTENQFWYHFDDRSENRYVIVKYAFAPPDSVLMHVNDITGQKRAEENLQYISIHDSLTGLFNRFYSDAEISRLAASRMRPVSIIVIDLNNLKKINDESGHAMGDLYIKNAANILRQTFRPEDMIARIGGDEFLIFLPLVDENICAQAVDRLNDSIRLFNQTGDFPISLSAGFATAQAGDNLLERIREADQRMYEDKALSKASREPSAPR